VALTGPGPTVDPGQLAALAAACRRHQRLRLRYRNRSGSESSRIVEPHRLVSTGYRWYLMAFDAGQADWRTFRVDRITDAAEDGGRFVLRDPPDPAAFVARAVTSAPYRYQACVLVHAPPHVVAQEVPPTTAVISTAGSGSCLLTTGSDSLAALTFHLSGLGADFTVLEPPELIEFVAETAGRLTRSAMLSGQAAAEQAETSPGGREPGPR
jgi:predicted DNA-binding transcriptional regulator YafY